MRPGARVAAAIDILDQIAEGDLPTEQALTRWARGSRFAGSKDRAAIRDYVFDVARQYRLAAHYGQGETGRALGTRRHRPRAPCKTARPLPCASTPPEPLWPR